MVHAQDLCHELIDKNTAFQHKLKALGEAPLGKAFAEPKTSVVKNAARKAILQRLTRERRGEREGKGEGARGGRRRRVGGEEQPLRKVFANEANTLCTTAA